jgi:hypothetical protein
MKSNHVTRRDFSVRLASVLSVLGASSAWAPGGSSRIVRPEGSDELSHSAEAIHQEVVIKAIGWKANYWDPLRKYLA